MFRRRQERPLRIFQALAIAKEKDTLRKRKHEAIAYHQVKALVMLEELECQLQASKHLGAER